MQHLVLPKAGCLRNIVDPAADPKLDWNSHASMCAATPSPTIRRPDAYPCTLGDNERWNFVKGRLQTMGTDKNALTCLGVTSGGKVELETCNDSPNQAWRIAAAGDIVNVGTNKCLDSMGKYGDVQLVIAPCKFNASQRWVLR